MEFNFLGVAFIADDVSKNKADKVNAKMEEILEKHKELAKQEFDFFLKSIGLESTMGVFIPKTE